MSAIGPQMWVERTEESPTGLFVRGSIYFVEALSSLGRTCVVCRARGVDEPDAGLLFSLAPGRVFCSRHWRPIYRPKFDLIQSLLKPVKAPAEGEGVDA